MGSRSATSVSAAARRERSKLQKQESKRIRELVERARMLAQAWLRRLGSDGLGGPQ